MIGFKIIVIGSPDTDMFLILLCYVFDKGNTIYLDRKKQEIRQLINVSKILPGVYVFTGEDCVGTFKGKGKITPLKILITYPKFHSAFKKLGKKLMVLEDVTKYLDDFVCVMYAYVQEA